MNRLASIDLGSHTARLLVARETDPLTYEPLTRERSYIYLAKGFDPVLKRITQTGAERAIKVLKDFSRIIREWGVDRVAAVATGVIREAANRDEFLLRVYEKTGINVTAISGEKEALLTARGALGALGIITPPYFLFDLGGGTTEIVCHEKKEKPLVDSLSLGAMVLTDAFLSSDPPLDREMIGLLNHIDSRLREKCPPFEGKGPVIGTGGTVTALYALLNGISLDAIVPERINGQGLALFQVTGCLEEMRRLTTKQRIEQMGLDSGRAQVMVAGAAVVRGLLRHLKAGDLLVSMSDLLEGALMDFR